MATPAPHVPVQFLKAGGSAFFSARCIKLLSKLGWEMEEFGTYSSVQDYQKKCRDDRAAGLPQTQRQYELGEPNTIPGPNGTNITNPLATKSGHLTLNSTQQTGRGEACANVTDGHNDSLSPCMTHTGDTNIAGGQHSINTAMEYNGALANGAVPGGGYAGKSGQAAYDQCQRDNKERLKNMVQRRQGENPQPATGEIAHGTAAAPADPNDPASPGAASGADPTAKEVRAPKDHQVDGGSASQCIENFRAMGDEGMKQHAASSKEIATQDRAANAGTPPGTEGGYAAAAAERDAAEAAHSAERRRTPPDPVALQAATDRRDAARGHANRCNAACRAAQGRRIASGEGRNGAVAPGNAGSGVPGTAACRQRTGGPIVPAP